MSPKAAGEALVGPNAVTQLAGVLERRRGAAEARALFAQAGLEGLYAEPPEAMLPERQAAALHQALWARLPAPEARALAFEAGWETGGYLLAHRIPKRAQGLLRVLPRPLALRLLLAAIARHAWTFAGSGRFLAKAGRETVIEIAANPLAAGRCTWHGAVFERLFRALVSPQAVVEEQACCAQGAPACRFLLTL